MTDERAKLLERRGELTEELFERDPLVGRLDALSRQISNGKSRMSESGPATQALIYNHLLSVPEMAIDRIIEAAALIERMDEEIRGKDAALAIIRDQEEYEIALDPDWPRRIARAALGQQGEG